MKDLLKHENFKFFTSMGLKILLIILLAWDILNCVVTIAMDVFAQGMMSGLLGQINGKNSALFTALDISDFSIILAVIVAMIVVNEFKSETIKNTAIYSFSRQSIFIAKFITQIIAVTFFVTIHILLYFAIFSLYAGWGEAFTFASLWNDFIKTYIMMLLLCYSLTAFFNFFAYYTKSTVLVIVAVFILMIISGIITGIYYVKQTPFTEFLYNISIANVIPNYINSPSIKNFISYIVLFSLLFFPATILSLLKFQKDEIK